MHHVATSRRIAAPHRDVWEMITDTHLWPRWGPTVRAVDYAPRWVAAGATGRIQTVARVWLPFEITEFVDGRSWAWKVAGVSATGHHLEALGDESTQLTFSVPWPAAAYLPVLRRGLTAIERLAGG